MPNQITWRRRHINIKWPKIIEDLDSFSLFELNEYIRRVIALNFQEPIWVHAEISQISESRGHYYLELIEKSENTDQVKARTSAVIWVKTYFFLKKKLEKYLPSLLQSGIEIRMKVQVEFHERYGLKLNILDLDPNFTLGKLELKRQQVLETLKKEMLVDLNGEIPLAPVLQRIAIISSSKAAGYVDFIAQIENNSRGYAFETELYETSVQGQSVKPEVIAALEKISAEASRYDCVVIIRGGGSKIDLAAFDGFEIGREIALCPIPVITGIGHEIDQSIADICAHTSLKTPTAAAEFLIDRMTEFESSLLNTGNAIKESARSKVTRCLHYLENLEYQVKNLGIVFIEKNKIQLTHADRDIVLAVKNLLHSSHVEIRQYNDLIDLSDPARNLAKGYAIVRYRNKILLNPGKLSEGDLVFIELATHELETSIHKINKL